MRPEAMEAVTGHSIPSTEKLGKYHNMTPEMLKAVMEGIKEAGINFVAHLPDSRFDPVHDALNADKELTVVPVSNEGVGVAVCCGAWLGGKMPAAVIPTSGFLVSVWPLGSLCMARGIPIVLIISYRGDLGDGQPVFRTYNYTTEPILRDLQIPYTVVRRLDEVKPALKAAVRSARGWMTTTAVLMSGEVIFGDR